MTAFYYHSSDLPWSRSLEEQRRFRFMVSAMLLISMVISLISSLTQVPPVSRFEREQISPRLAKLILERERLKPVPPPPPPLIEEVKPEPEKPKVEEAKSEPKPEVKKEPEPVPQKAEAPKVDVEAARKKAASSGLLAMKDQLADLRQKPLANASLPSKVNKLTAGSGDQTSTQRSIITSSATRGSGGIGTTAVSSTVGNTELASRNTTVVQSTIQVDEMQTTAKVSGRASIRSSEEIQLVLDQNKGAVNIMYQRALRKNPLLQGKVVLEMTIDETGKVVDCKVLSSELEDAEFIAKLIARVKLYNFGAKDVDVMVFTWPMDFLPNS